MISGIALITFSRLFTSRFNWHPTEQLEQVDRTILSALSHLWSRSTRAPTGHTSRHAPQNSHPDSKSDVPLDVPTSTFPFSFPKVICTILPR